MKIYKNIAILIIHLLISIILLGSNISSTSAAYTVVNNANDGVHNSLAATLIQIGSSFLNGTLSATQAISQGQAYIQLVSAGLADFAYSFSPSGILSIGCSNNGALIQFVPTTSTPTSTPTSTSTSTSTSASYSTYTAPPLPLLSCSYISSWTPTRSICNISSNWVNNNKIYCSQTATFTSIYTTLGQYSCPGIASQPSNTKVVVLSLNYSSNNCFDIYANGVKKCNLTFNLSGIPSEGISGFNGLNSKSTSFDKGFLDQTINVGKKGIRFNNSSLSGTTLNIPLDSLVPFSDNGTLEFDMMGKTNYSKLIYNNLNITFKKPFIGDLNVSNDGGSTWNDLPEIGTVQKYKININNLGNLTGYSNGNLNISNSTVKNTIIGHSFENFSNVFNNFKSNFNNYLGFTSRINAIDNILKTPIITSDNLEISYSLLGETVKYYLTQNTNGGDTNEFTIGTNGEISTLGLKVIGAIQGDGKSVLTGQEQNFSDLTKIELKNDIRKNAYLLTKNMTNGQIANGVKYVIGDYTISGNSLGFETIIIKDGNLIISGDLNTEGTKLGIIVLKDSYNVTTDYNNKGNIYIDNNVTDINAILYADGGVISSNNGNIYTTDNLTRTAELQTQLIIKGSLFTRNTIGGAILAGGDYLLPGGKNTSSFNNAMIYDLNYLRRGNEGNDSTYSDYTIIKYNSQIQTNPPIGFSN